MESKFKSRGFAGFQQIVKLYEHLSATGKAQLIAELEKDNPSWAQLLKTLPRDHMPMDSSGTTDAHLKKAS